MDKTLEDAATRLLLPFGGQPTLPLDGPATEGPGDLPEPVQDRLSGRYTLLEEVGRGGTGVVFRAWDNRLDAVRAIKVLRPGLPGADRLSRRLAREAIIGTVLDHPHIVRVHDMGVAGPYHYLVLDWMAGGSAWDRLARGHTWSPWQAARMGLQVLSALEAAHARGIVHRDVKPANMLFDGAGRTLLGDFGIARFPDADVVDTHERSILGSETYMPPEQRVGSERVSARSDLYALGASLFQLMTLGNPADLYLDPPDTGRWRRIPEIHRPPLVAATQLRPEDRPATAARLARMLYRALAEDPEAPPEARTFG
jgi:eukaryotic-like serine/threonine-protein kinase